MSPFSYGAVDDSFSSPGMVGKLPPALLRQPRVVRWRASWQLVLFNATRLLAILLACLAITMVVGLLFHPEIWEIPTVLDLFLLFWLLVVAAGVNFFYLRPMRRLYQEGLAAPAVIAGTEYQSASRRYQGWVAWYEFAQVDGRHRSGTLHFKFDCPLKVGDRVTVLYFDDREPHTVYEYGPFRCV